MPGVPQPLRLALAMFEYFPHGGLQRDCYDIAVAASRRGHQVTCWVGRWRGAPPPGALVRELGRSGLANHTRDAAFLARLRQELLRQPGSLLVGFQKMPGLHVYYAGDECVAERIASTGRRWLAWLPRLRQHLAFEQAVFAPAAATQVLLLAPQQRAAYERHYRTPPERLHDLAPGVRAAAALLPEPQRAARRAAARARLAVAPDQPLLLCVASNFRHKGLDRTLRAMAQLPPGWRQRARLAVAGAGAAAPFRRLAARLSLDGQVRFLGARDDVPELLSAADLLVHPARREAAGLVLLEAMVAGLPVLTTAVCGHAPLVRQHGMGQVLPPQAGAAELAAAMVELLAAPREPFLQRASALVAAGTWFGLPDRVVDLLEGLALP
jgi:UDP-glucose:(heptosyl)LPS alpha-1,3-glucosyltransferase